MRSKTYSLIVLTLVLFVAAIGPAVRADSVTSREHRVKAAFLYNFIKFVDWPEEKVADSNDTIAIGIIGKHSFGDAFEAVKGAKVKNKKIIVKHFTGFEQTKDKNVLKRCHLLFICSSEKQHLKDIIKIVESSNVLTVGDKDGVLESGGIIEFTMEGKKVRFEINIAAAKRAGLQIRSQLLRLAKKVVEE